MKKLEMKDLRFPQRDPLKAFGSESDRQGWVPAGRAIEIGEVILVDQ